MFSHKSSSSDDVNLLTFGFFLLFFPLPRHSVPDTFLLFVDVFSCSAKVQNNSKVSVIISSVIIFLAPCICFIYYSLLAKHKTDLFSLEHAFLPMGRSILHPGIVPGLLSSLPVFLHKWRSLYDMYIICDHRHLPIAETLAL